MFWKIFVICRYHWRVHYTSAIKRLNHSPGFFWCLTCAPHVSGQHFMFFFFVWRVLTRQWYVFFSLTCGLHVTEANFFYWRVTYTSVLAKWEEMPFDVWLTRQWYIFFSTDVWSTRHWCEFLLLTCPPHVSGIETHRLRRNRLLKRYSQKRFRQKH